MKWISVKDELPLESDDSNYDEYNTYCANNKYHKPIVTTLDWTEHGWYDGKRVCWNQFVTHWMPLPEPPINLNS